MDIYEKLISDFDHIEKEEFLSRAELKFVATRRSFFEEKIQCTSIQPVEYLKYISFENNLLALVKNRILQRSWKTGKRTHICCVRRIFHIYYRCLKKHRNSLSIWFSFLFFCSTQGSKNLSSKAISLALRFHPNSPGLWCYASTQDRIYSGKSFCTSFHQRALRLCSNKLMIWLDCFKVVLQHANVLQIRIEPGKKNNDRLLEGRKIIFRAEKRIFKLFIAAISYFRDPLTFSLKFLGLLASYSWTTRLKFSILNHIADVSSIAELWNLKARLAIMSSKATVNDSLLLCGVFDPSSANFSILEHFFDSQIIGLIRNRLCTELESFKKNNTENCVHEHLTLNFAVLCSKYGVSPLQLLDHFMLLLAGEQFIEAELIKRSNEALMSILNKLSSQFYKGFSRYDSIWTIQVKNNDEVNFLKNFARRGSAKKG